MELSERQPPESEPGSKRLREVCLLFLKLGTIAFGGPVAYIAMMRDEVVRRRHWVDDKRFLDLVGATNLIPGPNASEMAIHLGLIRAGWCGYAAAGILFILPGVLATLALAWFYVKYSSMPQIGWVLYGVKPAVIAIVVQALWGLGTSAVRRPLTAMVGATVVALYLLGVNAIVLLFSGATFFLLVRMGGPPQPPRYLGYGAPIYNREGHLWRISARSRFFQLCHPISNLSQNRGCPLWKWLCAAGFSPS